MINQRFGAQSSLCAWRALRIFTRQTGPARSIVEAHENPWTNATRSDDGVAHPCHAIVTPIPWRINPKEREDSCSCPSSIRTVVCAGNYEKGQDIVMRTRGGLDWLGLPPARSLSGPAACRDIQCLTAVTTPAIIPVLVW